MQRRDSVFSARMFEIDTIASFEGIYTVGNNRFAISLIADQQFARERYVL